MEKMTDQNNPGLAPKSRISDYQVHKRIELSEINAIYYELEHLPTGARHIHISNADSENSFGVIFKTVPTDSTGVAHILEHTVLCGSKRYPVRDPFFSMMKRSLSTFMNALTASDWTMYPFSTQNRKDFYNLMSVYLDAAFYPRLDRLSFKQEGHRLEFESGEDDKTAQLVYKGVVYNEMKGAMSSPDQLMARSLLNALYPDTTYSNNSGGDPAQIPLLTHQQLIDFHRHHYHPSNAYFYTYGNLPLADHLAFIEDKVLNHFTRIDPNTDVPSQPRWDRPRQAEYVYPVDAGEDLSKKCQVSVAWLTADIRQPLEMLALTILEQVLIGNSGSPLRKALIDSELGSTLADGTGFDSENKDTMFACGLKDVAEESADQVEAIMFDTLSDLHRNGIDKALVDSAIHQIEFHQKEITNSPYPYGLKLLLRFCGDWLHHGDPALILKFDQLMDQLRREMAAGPFLEEKIKTWFLDNPHRVRLLLRPDIQKAAQDQRMEAEQLATVRKKLTESDIQAITEDTQRLLALQDEEEDLSSLPTLEKDDIPPEVERVAVSAGYDEAIADFYEQPTSGIFYFTAALGLNGLSDVHIPMLPLFCHAISRCGTARHSDSEMAQIKDLVTGGIGWRINAATSFKRPDNDVCLPLVTINAKCLSKNVEKMFDLMGEIMGEMDFRDLNLLKHLVLEYRSDLDSAIVSGGHRYAVSLASRNFTPAARLNERWHGIHQLRHLKDISGELDDEKLKAISDDLIHIASVIFNRKNMKAGLIGEASDLKQAETCFRRLRDQLDGTAASGLAAPADNFQAERVREGWSTATAVSFVASVMETRRLQHEDAPALAVISKILRSMFLHREIREKGGAYGGFAGYQTESGLFYFASYRDPHIVNTLKVFQEAARFITTEALTEENIKEAILQVCADIDRPDTPAAMAIKAFYRKLVSLDDEMRQTFKKRLLQLDGKRVREVALTWFDKPELPTAVAVISNEQALKDANSRLEPKLRLNRI